MACVSPVNLYFLTFNPYDNVIYFYLLFTKVKFNKKRIKRIVKEDKKRILRINRLQTERKCPESGFRGTFQQTKKERRHPAGRKGLFVTQLR